MTAPNTNPYYQRFKDEQREASRYFSTPLPPAATQQGFTPGDSIPQHGQPDPATLADTELLGQARFYGIEPEVASQMRRQDLEAYIRQMRMETQLKDDTAAGMATIAAQIPARAALGVGQAITGGLMRMPLVGEWARKNEAVRSADMWLNELEEGVRATAPAEGQWVGATSEAAGQIAGLWYPGNAAWKVAGAAGRLVPFAGRVTSPILRTAAQGGASAWLLEGGSENPVLAVGAGTLLGPLATPQVMGAIVGRAAAVQAAAQKVSAKFGGRWERFVGKADEAILRSGDLEGLGARSPLGPYPAPGMRTGREETLRQLNAAMNDPSVPFENRETARVLYEQLTGDVPPVVWDPSLPMQRPELAGGRSGRPVGGMAEAIPEATEEIESQRRMLQNLVGQGEPGIEVSGGAGMVRVKARGPNGEPVGVLQLAPNDAGGHDVLSVYVDPSMRRQGIASQMYAAAEAQGLKVRSGQSGLTEEGAALVASRQQPSAPTTDVPYVSISNRQLSADPQQSYDEAVEELENWLGQQNMTADDFAEAGLDFMIGNRRWIYTGFDLMEVDPVTRREVGTAASSAWDQVRSMMDEGAAGIARMTGMSVEEARAKISPLLTQEVRLGTPPEEIVNLLRSELDDLAKMNSDDLGLVMSERMVKEAGMTTDDASAAAAQMAKMQTVIDSPQLSRAAGLPDIDDVVVAQAAVNSNPGGTNIIPAVGDPGAFMRGIAANWPEMPHVAFARRGQALAAIISDQPITSKMVAEFEQVGMYSGQRAIKAKGGLEGTIESINVEAGTAKFRPGFGRRAQTVKLSQLLPHTQTPGVQRIPGAWDAFKQFQQAKVDAIRAEIPGVGPERIERIAMDHMPAHMEEFLDGMGIEDIAQRARVRQYLNEEYVAEYTKLVPQEEAALLSQIDEARDEIEAVVDAVNSPNGEELRRMGAARGVDVIRTGSNQYEVVDAVGDQTAPTRLSFGSREAAEEWIRNVPRELPDITPAADIPIEVVGELPTVDKLDPILRADQEDAAAGMVMEDVVQTLRNDGDELADQIEAAAAQVPGATGGGPGDIRTARERIEDAWNYFASRWQPMRARYLEIDRRLSAAGRGELRVYDDWNAVKTAADKNHNWQHPYLSRWRQIMSVFDVKDLRGGLVTSIYEIDDDVARIAAARQAGFSDEQIAALDQMNQFFKDLFPETGLDPARELKRYISHVRKREMAGAGAQSFEDYPMNPVVDAFYEHARAGGMQMRELDARQLGNIYVRALGFQKFMAEPWGAAMAKWNDLAHVPELEGLSGVMTNWLKMVRTGYNPAADVTLNTIHVAMKSLFPGMTKDQSRHLFNNGLSLTHGALLGYSPHVMARDLMQLFLATPRTGHRQMASAIGEYLNGSMAQKDEIFQLGIKHGWVVLGKPRIAAPGVFEQGAGSGVGAIERAAVGLPAEAAAGPETGGLWPVVKAAENVLDMLPGSMRNLEGSKFSPLHFYTKQGERMRLVTGLAQFRKTEAALAKYRAAGAGASMDDLMGESAARTFDPAVQRKFKELVAAGQDEEAAAYMARELTDATMFRYGTIENPEVARSVHGRIGMQMGSFSTQYYQYLKESLRNGTVSDKVRFGATHAAVFAALAGAKEATGWAFDKWQFHNALFFTGGPWMGVAMDVIKGTQGVAATASGRGGTFAEREAAGLDRAAREIGRMVNPIAGAQRTAQSVMYGLNSPDPVAGVARALIVGERASDTQGILQPQQAQPLPPGPVRSSAYGMPVPMPMAPQRVWIGDGEHPYTNPAPVPDSAQARGLRTTSPDQVGPATSVVQPGGGGAF